MKLYSPNILIPNAPPVGLTLGWVNGNTVTVAAGAVPMRDRNSSASNPRYTMAVLPTALMKYQAPWAAGNNQGARFGSPPPFNSTAHFFLIRDRTSGQVDVGIDTDASGANIPTTYDIRRIGSIPRLGNYFINFSQTGNFFSTEAVTELNTTNLSTTAGNPVTLTGVPSGVVCRALLRIDLGFPNTLSYAVLGSGRYGSGLIQSDNTTNYQRFIQEALTNTSRQIQFWSSAANTNCTILSQGFYHPLDFYW